MTEDSPFACPITCDDFRDPVIDPDGNTYEKSAILSWLQRNGTSPITRTSLRADQLVPNRALAKIIREQQARNMSRVSFDPVAFNPFQDDDYEEQGSVVSFRCPISRKHIEDPVIDPDGNTYEKSAILRWLSYNATSPITENPLRPEQLVPNRALAMLLKQHEECESVEQEDWTVTEQDAPQVRVKLQASYNHNERALLRVKVSDDNTTKHTPSTIVLIIDESLTKEMVKNACQAVVGVLEPHDQLAIVSFSYETRVVFPLTNMTKRSHDMANESIKTIPTREGGMDISNALISAMNIIRNAGGSSGGTGSRNSCIPNANILIFTDGTPNIHPAVGEVNSIIRYKRKYPKINFRISTFGLGCQIDGQLLNSIADIGRGHYYYIPDCDCVRSTFIDAAANVLATALPKTTIKLKMSKGFDISQCLSGHSFSKNVTHGSISIHLPPLLYGQTLDILLILKAVDPDDSSSSKSDDGQQIRQPQHRQGGIPFQATLYDSSRRMYGSRLTEYLMDAVLAERKSVAEREIQIATVRSWLIRFIRRAERCFRQHISKAEAIKTVNAELKDVKKLITSHTTNSNILELDAIREDIDDQVTKAYSRLSHYYEWGSNYALSLCRAHVLQQCSNSRERSIHVYATQKFKCIRRRCADAAATDVSKNALRSYFNNSIGF